MAIRQVPSDAVSDDHLKTRGPLVRFRLQTLLLVFAILSFTLWLWMRFVEPSVLRHWAIAKISDSGNKLIFDERNEFDEDGMPSDLYGKPRDAASRNLMSITATDDGAAIEAARRVHSIPEVRQLSLGNQVTDKGLSAISQVEAHPALQLLALYDSPVTREGVAQLAELEWLRNVMLCRSAINADVVTGLESIASLEQLWLTDTPNKAGMIGSENPNRITEEIAAAVSKLHRLRFLALSNLNVSDASARHLHELKNLQVLGLSDCRISDEALDELHFALPNCKIEVSSNW
jgi:hypothetical protein